MEYINIILNGLIDEYEKKGCCISNSSQKICYNVYKKIKEYSDRYNFDASCAVEADIEKMLSNKYIIAEPKDEHGLYHKLFLNFKFIDEIYSFLNRTPVSQIRNELKNTLSKYLCSSPEGSVAYNYCTQQLSRLESNKNLENQICDDNEKLENILMVLSAIARLDRETYTRNFSEAVFHDSKKFAKLQSTVVSILQKYSSEPLEDDQKVLEWFNLFENPIYLYIKGSCIIYYPNGEINVGASKGGVAISPDSISDIKHIKINCDKVITVENLTTYHDTPENNAVVIYLGGFHNSVRTQLLSSIYSQNPHINYFHKGDLDIYGFLILENLKKKTGINFEPYEMDIKTLKQCYYSGFYKPLTKTDVERSQSPLLDKYRDVIDFMLENNCKVEQESLEAMKLNI